MLSLVLVASTLIGSITPVLAAPLDDKIKLVTEFQGRVFGASDFIGLDFVLNPTPSDPFNVGDQIIINFPSNIDVEATQIEVSSWQAYFNRIIQDNTLIIEFKQKFDGEAPVLSNIFLVLKAKNVNAAGTVSAEYKKMG